MKIDVAMHGIGNGSSSITWIRLSHGTPLVPLLDELEQLSSLSLDRRLEAIVAIRELNDSFEVVVP